MLLKKPNVYGSIFRFEGQASVFAPHLGGPCYRCLYPEPPPPGMVPSCAEGGVLGVLPGIIGCIQATEILKLAIGKGSSLVGRLLLFNALDMKFRELKLRRDPACPVCGDHPTITELIDYEVFCGIETKHEPASNPDEVTVQEMKRALDDPKLGIKVLDIRESFEYDIAHVDGVPLLDLDYPEDSCAEVDANVVMTGDGGLVEVQATAERTPLSRAHLDDLLALAELGIAQLQTAQDQAVTAGS